VHNEIHNIKKPSEALPSQQGAGKGNFFVFRPDYKGDIRSPKATVPSGTGLRREY